MAIWNRTPMSFVSKQHEIEIANVDHDYDHDHELIIS